MKKVCLLWAVIMLVVAVFSSVALAVDQPSDWSDQSLEGAKVAFCYQCLGLPRQVGSGEQMRQFAHDGYQTGYIFLIQNGMTYVKMSHPVPGGMGMPNRKGEACGIGLCLSINQVFADRCLVLANADSSVDNNENSREKLDSCWQQTLALNEKQAATPTPASAPPSPSKEDAVAAKVKARPHPSYVGLPQREPLWYLDPGQVPDSSKSCLAGEVPGTDGTANDPHGNGISNRKAQDEWYDIPRVEAIAPSNWDGTWALVHRTEVLGPGAAGVWCLRANELVGPGQVAALPAKVVDENSPPPAAAAPATVVDNTKKIRFEKVAFDLPAGSEDWYFETEEQDEEIVVTMHVGKLAASLWDNFKLTLRLDGGYGNYGSSYRPIQGWYKASQEKIIDESGIFVPGADIDLILVNWLEIGAGATLLYALENPSTRQTGWGLRGNVRFYPTEWWQIRVGPFADFPGIARHEYWADSARTDTQYEASANIYGGYAALSWGLYAVDRFVIWLNLPEGYVGQDENDQTRYRFGGGLHFVFGGPALQNNW